MFNIKQEIIACGCIKMILKDKQKMIINQVLPFLEQQDSQKVNFATENVEPNVLLMNLFYLIQFITI